MSENIYAGRFPLRVALLERWGIRFLILFVVRCTSFDSRFLSLPSYCFFPAKRMKELLRGQHNANVPISSIVNSLHAARSTFLCLSNFSRG